MQHGKLVPERARCAGPGSCSRCCRSATRSAPVSAGCAALRSPSSPADLRLLDVVGAGRAAAQLPFGGLDEPDVADGAQQLARRAAHALGVREVAGVLVGDGGGCSRAGGAPRRPSPARKTLTSTTRSARRRAASSSGAPANSSPYSCIPEPQPAALTTTASTSSRERREVAAGEAPGLVGGAGVHGQRAAAALRARDDGLDAVGASTRSVAQPMSGARTCWAQPASSATRARRSPCAGKTSGSGRGRGTRSGSRRSIAASDSGRTRASGRARRPSTAAVRNRAGRAACAGSARAARGRAARGCAAARRRRETG